MPFKVWIQPHLPSQLKILALGLYTELDGIYINFTLGERERESAESRDTKTTFSYKDVLGQTPAMGHVNPKILLTSETTTLKNPIF